MPEDETAAPVIGLWDGAVAVPLMGTLDGVRGREVTQALLEGVAGRRARFAILDITSVTTVGPQGVRYLVATAAAVRLTGAECVVCGIRPALARDVVRPGRDLGTVVVRTSLDDALAYALRRLGADAADPAAGGAGAR